MRTFALGAIVATATVCANVGTAQELFVAVSPAQFSSADEFLTRISSHEAMAGLDVNFVVKTVEQIPPLPETSAYLAENGFSFLLSSDINELISPDEGELAYTALLGQSAAFSSLEEQRAVEASIFGQIVEVELGSVDLIALSDWTTAPSVLLARGFYDGPSALEGQRVIANSERTSNAMKQVGAEPLIVGMGESVQALNRGLADALVISPEVALMNFDGWDASSTVTGVDLPQGYLLAELNAWTDLGEAQRQALRTAATDVAREERERQLLSEQDYFARVEEAGLQAFEFQSIVGSGGDMEAVTAEWQERFGDQGTAAVNLLQQVLADTETSLPQPETQEPPRINPDPIAYATNRLDEGGVSLSTRFGARRDPEAELTCGLADPVSPRQGRFGKPYAGTISQVAGASVRGASDCVSMLDGWVGDDARIVIFLHGFNNTFDDAVRRAVAYKHDVASDLKFIVWSWPSLGDAGGYVYDARNVTFSRSYLRDFAEEFIDAGLHKRTTVIAHSMGSMVALALLEYLHEAGGNVEDLFLVAPDVPGTVFGNFLVDYNDAAQRITLYANAADKALITSYALNRERPIGLGGRKRYLAEGVETIDVTDKARSIKVWKANHSHAFDIPVVAFDMADALRSGETALQRGLARFDDGSGFFYRVVE